MEGPSTGISLACSPFFLKTSALLEVLLRVCTQHSPTLLGGGVSQSSASPHLNPQLWQPHPVPSCGHHGMMALDPVRDDTMLP